MRSLFLIFFILSFTKSHPQKTIIVKTSLYNTSQDMLTPFKRVFNTSKFTFSKEYDSVAIKYVPYDQRQVFIEEYIDGVLSGDSLQKILSNHNSKISNQVFKRTKHSIYIQEGFKLGKLISITVDVNSNRNFLDDKAFSFTDKQTKKFSIHLDRVIRGKVRKSTVHFKVTVLNESFDLESKKSNNYALYISSTKSFFVKFNISNSVFQAELIQQKISSSFEKDKLSVNISGPNKSLKMTDNIYTILYSAQKDTIISGDYKIIIDSITESGDAVVIKYWKIEHNYGYFKGYNMPNFNIDVFDDSVRITQRLKEFVINQKYILLDFWGTWCAPCIRNFDRLKTIDSLYKYRGLVTISFACEYNFSVDKVLNFLRRKHVFWVNGIVEMNNNSVYKLTDYLKIRSFPTYILLDSNLKIITRNSGENSLNDIQKIIQDKLK